MHMPNGTLWKREISRLFACIIGIDNYKSEELPPLRSSVRHAQQFKDYLTQALCVPEFQICMLTGENASRNAILNSLASFEGDTRINTGDPILIFYAGHSTDILTSSDRQLGAQCYVQSLVPQDYCSIPGLEVPCIPEITLGSHLDGIAESKGNNITVILDCCHSVSTSARGVNTGTQIRSASIRQNPDYASWHPNPRFRNRNPCSHILLSACSSFHRSREPDLNSIFLAALLQLLQSTPPDQLRYSQIPPSIAFTHNLKPHIEGIGLERFLFGTTPPSFFSQVHCTLGFDAKSGLYIINSGIAHGIIDGTIFDIRSGPGLRSTNIGTLFVEQAKTFFSFVNLERQHLVSLFNLQSTELVQRRPGKRPHQLRLFITHNHRYQNTQEFIIALLEDPKYDLHNIALVDHPDQAHLEVSVNGSRATFQLIDQRALKHGVRYRYPRVDPNNDNVASFLRAASDYFWELDRMGDVSALTDDIEVAFYPLTKVSIGALACDADTGMEMKPLEGQNFVKDSEIDIVVSDDRYFGIKVVNHGRRDVFLVLQYYDCRSLSIPETYYPHSLDTSDLINASINAGGGTLTIGYGPKTTRPPNYYLERGQDINIGFLKLFAYSRSLGVRPTTLDINQQDTWGTRVIPIIQRRYPKHPSTVRPTSWPNTGITGSRGIIAAETHVHPLSGRSRSLQSKHV